MNTAVIVPTFNADSMWVNWINALLATGQNVKDIYIIDSGSSDNTVLQSRNAGFNVKQIELATFNHGGTRQMGVTDLKDYDFVIFLTQDAILCEKESLESILKPFESEDVAAVCGRQLRRMRAGPIESHARLFNYPKKSIQRSMGDVGLYGLKTAFISNSFAAYRISALNKVGGFPDDVIFGEDMYVAAKMLLAGYKIAYVADACVYHSHGYSLWQEMQRYFDMGVFHASEPWIRKELGGAEGEGIKFVVSEVNYLLKNAFWLIPEGILRTLIRYIGFRLGLLERRLPLGLKKRLAMNKSYFK